MRASSAVPSLEWAEAARRLSRDTLSLALIESRNRTLRWFHLFEAAQRLDAAPAQAASVAAVLARLAFWQRGASLEDAALLTPPLHDAQGLLSRLSDGFEPMLEQLDAAPDDDHGLHCFRHALVREERAHEALAQFAQSWALDPAAAGITVEPLPARSPREPLWLPAQRITVGIPAAVTAGTVGFIPWAEQGCAHEEVPAFEIDAQAVNWSQVVAFAEDGGYDTESLWTAQGWEWLNLQVQRGPAYVEQLRGGAVAHRFGRLQRLPAQQAAAHVSRHEAMAWCRWAGRRLPTEFEWEVAALTACGLGFVWGDVREWTLNRPRLWDDHPRRELAQLWGVEGLDEPAGGMGAQGGAGAVGVLRGCSRWTAERQRHPRQRWFSRASSTQRLVGFRSCAQ